ncbi:MAG: UDP-N-acetylmuramoyl-L-alanine--D-glutamate ligase [Thermaerobacter sp.]|nr:UDP-N-acetylmuramoyl-L-alanine--D-glutamate ligase [Thermaerobacter sp.]
MAAPENILILGFGINNAPLLPYWVARGARVTVADRNESVVDPAATAVRWTVGPSYVEQAQACGPYDRIYLTPGIPPHHPDVQRLAAGAVLTCETDLFLALCPAPVLGITGSAGKTTTTTLLGAMLAEDGRRPVHVGGNIGRSLFAIVEAIQPGDWVAMELSSFQLQLVTKSPAGAAVLNLSPNHLDHHRDMGEYAAAKARIFQFQSPDDFLVTDAVPPPLMAAALARHRGQRVTVSLTAPVEQGAYLEGGTMMWRPEPGRAALPIQTLDRWRLPGRMNVHNALVAMSLALRAGARPEAVAAALAAFRGVPHRLELVAEQGGIRYINDSIATAPDRTLAALDALGNASGGGRPRPLVLVAGGYDKHLDYGPLGRALAERARMVALTGPTGPDIARAISAAVAPGSGPRLLGPLPFDDAVQAALEAAEPGDIVLLSPASASYDAFRNFEERGQRFRTLVACHLGP